MPKCSAMDGKKPCTKEAMGDSGYCHKHGGKVAKSESVTYTMQLACTKGSTTPNSTFAELAQQTIALKPYALRIEAMRAEGPRTGGELIHGVMLLHNTQPRNNCTVFYNWVGNAIIIYGLGEHVGKDNDNYTMTWFDGSTKKWRRG